MNNTKRFYFSTEQSELVKTFLQAILDSSAGDNIEIEHKDIFVSLKVGHRALAGYVYNLEPIEKSV